jgi:hypothetical protein
VTVDMLILLSDVSGWCGVRLGDEGSHEKPVLNGVRPFSQSLLLIQIRAP